MKIRANQLIVLCVFSIVTCDDVVVVLIMQYYQHVTRTASSLTFMMSVRACVRACARACVSVCGCSNCP